MASLLRRAVPGAGCAARGSAAEPLGAPRVAAHHEPAPAARVGPHSPTSWRAPARQPSVAAPRPADRPTWTRASADAPAAGLDKELWSAGDMYAEGAERLRAFMAALPELAEQEEVLGGLLGANPELVAADPATVRTALEALAAALGVNLLRAARLAARVPGVLERPAEEAGSKVSAMAAELGTDVDAALQLYAAQPGMWAVSQPSIIRDRLDTLAGKLGLPLRNTVALVGKQALLWVIPPSHIQVSLRDVAGCCGLSDSEAEELVARVPPLLAVEKRLLKLSVAAVTASTGVPSPALLELLSRSLGLVALPSPLLCAALEGLAADLGVAPEHVAALMAQQPTLLCAQFGTIAAALETLETALQCSRPQALAVLCAQPCLMYETTVDTLVSRIQSLATTFGLPDADAARALAREQPALMVVAPATVRSAASAVGAALGGSLADCLALAKSDPGSFMMVTLQDSLIEAWSARLQLEPEAVARLLSLQPALLELTATTLKARLESLAALFGVPAEIAAQLVLKHPALAAVPPNATITRAKNVSMALRISIQGAAGIIAKEPALLAVLTHASDEVKASGVADDVGEVGAIYEYYTMEWLQRQYKEMAPARVTSFSALDS